MAEGEGAFNALTALDGRQEWHSAYKNTALEIYKDIHEDL